ncbi:uncharacterized protein LOC118766896 [Octopus sinensis]|uniref:Uncharacterized protein LOC118766896 n=1 Tax=Octopus sinensis TaxID=2607531 RepID=A0A7E6FGG0_9MOLL|nr:uncharacterized protein LOC118766896 [Octopus sinensis]
MNSTNLDSFTDLHSSVHDGQDSDDCVSDENYDDILFSDTPCFSFNKLFENTQNTKTENTDSIPNSVGKANDRWNRVYMDTNIHHKASKVRFAADEKLETKHLMLAWSYAYQAARKGEWVQIHIDSERFRRRIENTEQVLKPILDPSHRLKILALRKKYEHYSMHLVKNLPN